MGEQAYGIRSTSKPELSYWAIGGDAVGREPFFRDVQQGDARSLRERGEPPIDLGDGGAVRIRRAFAARKDGHEDDARVRTFPLRALDHRRDAIGDLRGRAE